MDLPDLLEYRSDFTQQGVKYPLPAVSLSKQGLLTLLPECSPEKTGWPWSEETKPSLYNKRSDWPKLTIVTPSFNQGSFLEETIRSILLQNYPNLEYIVIDGGSTDNSIDILKKYAPWLSYWQSNKDNGQAHAINLGFSLASGDYYAWINSDDYYLKDVFHRIVNSFLDHKVGFIYGYGYNLNALGNFELVAIPPLLDYFIKIPSLIQPSCFWKSSIHKPVWEHLYCALDFELWLRLVKGSRRKRLRLPLSVAHVHDNAKTSDPQMKIKWHEDHLKIWSDDGHGVVTEWKRIVFLNKIRMKLYKFLNLI